MYIHLNMNTMMVVTAIDRAAMIVAQPAVAPTLRYLPDRVSGIPIYLDNLDFAVEMPKSRLQDKPPLFILTPHTWSSSRSAFFLARNFFCCTLICCRLAFAQSLHLASIRSLFAA